MLTSGKTPWLAVALHRMCIITVITSSFEIGWGLWERPVCLHCYFQLLLLVADVSRLCGLNLSDKGGASLPLGTSFIHVSDLFLLPRPPWIHIAFIRVVEGGGGNGGVGGGAHCRIWAQCGGFLPLLLWNISTIFQQVFFFLKKKNVFLVINVWRIDASQLSLVHFKQQKQSLFPPGGISS